MESANDHRHARRPQSPRAVHRAGKLVRLHADEADHAKAAIVLNLAGDVVRPDAGIGLVDREDLDRDVLAKDLIFHAFLSNAEQAGERIGRQRRLPPLDDVALVVVMRRLDKEKQKTSACGDIRHVSAPREITVRPNLALRRPLSRPRPLPVLARIRNRRLVRPHSLASARDGHPKISRRD